MARLRIGYIAPTGGPRNKGIDPVTFVDDLRRACDLASQFVDTFWLPDHLMVGDAYWLECWTQLTWLAARYPGRQLGAIFCNSYRHPPLMAKMGATIQTLSRGRFVLGYGAGWLEDEYRAYGYDFPSTRLRIEQMAEAVQLIRRLWTEDTVTFSGRHYSVRDLHFNPRPDPVPPIMIAGDGERFLLRAVAEHADWWAGYARDASTLRHKLQVLAEHCRDIGRDPESIEKVYPMIVFLAGSRTQAQELAGEQPQGGERFVGDPGELCERLEELRELGFRHVAMEFGGFPDTRGLRLFANEVLPVLT